MLGVCLACSCYFTRWPLFSSWRPFDLWRPPIPWRPACLCVTSYPLNAICLFLVIFCQLRLTHDTHLTLLLPFAWCLPCGHLHFLWNIWKIFSLVLLLSKLIKKNCNKLFRVWRPFSLKPYPWQSFVSLQKTSVADPGCLSRISGPKTATKERGEKKSVVIPFYVTANFTKLKIILVLKCWRKTFGPIFKEL